MVTRATLTYHGGKSPNARSGIGVWVAGLLLDRPKYIEPCGGMLGVLLQRKPATTEIVNDLDHDIINWWKAVRDHSDELIVKLNASPHSRALYEESWELLHDDKGTLLERAYATAVVLNNGLTHGMGSSRKGWVPSWRGPVGMIGADVIQKLRARLQNVQLECTDAVTLLQKTADFDDAMIYIDPPYIDTNCNYRHSLNVIDMINILKDATASIAISGYPGNPWESLTELGWSRKTLQTTGLAPKGQILKRTEVCWMNYDAPPQYTLQLGI